MIYCELEDQQIVNGGDLVGRHWAVPRARPSPDITPTKPTAGRKLAAHCEDFEQLSVGNWLELKIEHVQSSLVSRN